MERKELFISVDDFMAALKDKEMNSKNFKGFRKGKAPSLLMTFLHGDETMQQLSNMALYREMLEQMKDGWSIKDFQIHGIKQSENQNNTKGWRLVVDIEREKIEDKNKTDKSDDQNDQNNNTQQTADNVNHE